MASPVNPYDIKTFMTNYPEQETMVTPQPLIALSRDPAEGAPGVARCTSTQF